MSIHKQIDFANTCLGIELGSTTIKLVVVDEYAAPIAVGKHVWENQLRDGYWTYDPKDIHSGLRSAYADLKKNIKETYGVTPTTYKSMGLSAMMHGYIALDEDSNLLVPFRTWRNTVTGEAAEKLSELFKFNIPQRWSIAHLYQAMLNKEAHLPNIKRVATLSAYLHYLLTDEFVIGVGDASGMFPIDSESCDYNSNMLERFDQLLAEHKLPYSLSDIFPKVCKAGDAGGLLSESGAAMLDDDLKAGIPMCPPEGDAGTGMVATNSVERSAGNVSAGTSIFAMVVLQKPLSDYYEEIDIVSTPDGSDVAMVHCNNCTSDLDAWGVMFSQFAETIGVDIKPYKVLDKVFEAAKAKTDYSGVVSFNYLSGEHITGVESGRPMLLRKPDAEFSFSALSKSLVFSTLSSLKIGLDILSVKEGVQIQRLMGHGGFFKADFAKEAMAAVANAQVSVMETAGEGGAYGMALLALYMNKKTEKTLPEFLNNDVFSSGKIKTANPSKEESKLFEEFLIGYKGCIPVERSAADCFQ